MSTRRNNGSHYENHHRAAELQNLPAHAHRVAEAAHGKHKQEHVTGPEQSRYAQEHHPKTKAAGSTGSESHGTDPLHPDNAVNEIAEDTEI